MHNKHRNNYLAASMKMIIAVDALLSPNRGTGFPFSHKMTHSRKTKLTSSGKVYQQEITKQTRVIRII